VGDVNEPSRRASPWPSAATPSHPERRWTILKLGRSLFKRLRVYARSCAPARDRAAHLIRDDKKPSPGAGQNGDGFLLTHTVSGRTDR
jgi:hypothetical protein